MHNGRSEPFAIPEHLSAQGRTDYLIHIDIGPNSSSCHNNAKLAAE